MEAERSFQPRPEEVRSVRRFVAAALDGAPFDAADITLLASEVATNAVIHARTTFTVRVITNSSTARVEVIDQGPPLPHPLPPKSPGDPTPGGRGLSLVTTVADRWGVEDRASGKAVWFEVGRRP